MEVELDVAIKDLNSGGIGKNKVWPEFLREANAFVPMLDF